MEVFKPPQNFDFESSNLEEEWRRWSGQFEHYHVACELEGKSKSVQVAILLHSIGAEGQDIHSQFEFATGEDKEDYKIILKKFKEYCQLVKTLFLSVINFGIGNSHKGSRLTCG